MMRAERLRYDWISAEYPAETLKTCSLTVSGNPRSDVRACDGFGNASARQQRENLRPERRTQAVSLYVPLRKRTRDWRPWRASSSARSRPRLESPSIAAPCVADR